MSYEVDSVMKALDKIEEKLSERESELRDRVL